jgi:adenylyl cyclase-associated protein
MGAVFSQLQQGENVTSGLRKVDPSQQTHKNPNLRGTAPVVKRSDSQGSSRSVAPQTKPKPEGMRGVKQEKEVKKEGKMELDGTKWFIVSLAKNTIHNEELMGYNRKTTTLPKTS